MPDAPKAARKPTKAQRAVLSCLGDGGFLVERYAAGFGTDAYVGTGKLAEPVSLGSLRRLKASGWLEVADMSFAIMAHHTYYALTPLGRSALSAEETD